MMVTLITTCGQEHRKSRSASWTRATSLNVYVIMISIRIFEFHHIDISSAPVFQVLTCFYHDTPFRQVWQKVLCFKSTYLLLCKGVDSNSVCCQTTPSWEAQTELISIEKNHSYLWLLLASTAASVMVCKRRDVLSKKKKNSLGHHFYAQSTQKQPQTSIYHLPGDVVPVHSYLPWRSSWP